MTEKELEAAHIKENETEAAARHLHEAMRARAERRAARLAAHAAKEAAAERVRDAAPELLAALEHVLIASEDGGTFNDVNFEMLRAAIAKARGEK